MKLLQEIPQDCKELMLDAITRYSTSQIIGALAEIINPGEAGAFPEGERLANELAALSNRLKPTVEGYGVSYKIGDKWYEAYSFPSMATARGWMVKNTPASEWRYFKVVDGKRVDLD